MRITEDDRNLLNDLKIGYSFNFSQIYPNGVEIEKKIKNYSVFAGDQIEINVVEENLTIKIPYGEFVDNGFYYHNIDNTLIISFSDE